MKRIGDIPIPCRHPEHDPPEHIVLPPGFYEHECPACGRKIQFTVWSSQALAWADLLLSIDAAAEKQGREEKEREICVKTVERPRILDATALAHEIAKKIRARK